MASWLAGGYVRVSGFEAGLAVFICTCTPWCLCLSSLSFVFRLSLVFLLCLSSVLVRTAGCLSPSPSLRHCTLGSSHSTSLLYSYSFRFFCQFGFPCDDVKKLSFRVLQVSSLCLCCLPVAGTWGLRAV